MRVVFFLVIACLFFVCCCLLRVVSLVFYVACCLLLVVFGSLVYVVRYSLFGVCHLAFDVRALFFLSLVVCRCWLFVCWCLFVLCC